MGLLDGRVAFVTGAARGMGRNHAVRFAKEGASVIAVDLCAPIAAADYELPGPADLDETARLIEEAGGRAFTRIVDVRDAEGLEAAVADGVRELDADGGAVDIVVANAGISRSSGGLLDTAPEVWRETIDINLTGVFLTMQVAAKAMVARKRGGSIILISSIMGMRSYGGVPAYTAAKHGVVGLMRTGAQEFAHAGVRVNAIHPGNVNTDMINNQAIRHLFRPDLESPTAEDVAPGFQGMNLMAHPWVEKDDITEAVLWLASDLSRFVTGISLPVDLGALAK
jgi:SDR family mycofactocin-dependent oxidoreductase